MKHDDRSPGDDLKALWRRQPSTTGMPSLAQTRARAQAFRARARRRAVAGGIGAALAIALLGAQAFAETDTLARAGELAIALGVAVAAGLLRRPWPRDLPESAATASTVIAFHAEEIRRQKYSIALVVAAVVPAVAGIVLALAAMWRRDPRPQFAAYLPVVTLLVLWAVVYGALHRRRARRLQRELEELARPPAD